jgi:hypothetical protein
MLPGTLIPRTVTPLISPHPTVSALKGVVNNQEKNQFKYGLSHEKLD